MSKLQDAFRTTRFSIWLIFCALILAATSVYAAGDGRPLAAVDIIGSPDAAVTGQFAVGTATPGNKALTVAGVIDFVGAGTVHNYFTQGPGNNMQIRSNVDEYNSVGNASYAQWNMVMGASLDVFSIRRSPASSTYNEDALFWIEGSTGNIGISKVDTSNGASIPFTVNARLHVETDSGDAIRGVTNATSGVSSGVYGVSDSTAGYGVYGQVNATSGDTSGVYGYSASSEGRGVYGWAAATSGNGRGVYGVSSSTDGIGVFGSATAASGSTDGVYGVNASTEGRGVYGTATATTGLTYGVFGRSNSNAGVGVYGFTIATSGVTYGVYGSSYSTSGYGMYGYTSATSGTTYGVYGRSDSTSGRGVYGHTTATIGDTYGVQGRSDSTQGIGVYGNASATSGDTYGVNGVSSSTDGYGVIGHASATSGVARGVSGSSNSSDGMGVAGYAFATSGTNYGVYGFSFSSTGFDFYAAGAGTDYGPFTGAHEVLLSGSFPQDVPPGLIVSASGEAQIRIADDGNVDLSSTLPTVKLADTPEDNAVLGVLVAEVTLPEDHWYTPAEDDRFGIINALGEGRVWVTDRNGDIKAGDAITTSIIPGFGQRQTNNRLELFTLGKATETIDWDTVTETVTFNGQEYKAYLLAVVYTSG